MPLRVPRLDSLPPRSTRRRFLASLGGIGAAVVATDACLFEPNRVIVTHHRLGSRRTGSTSLSLVQLSDLHLRDVGLHEDRIAREVGRLSPDVMLLTGDVLDRRDRAGALRDFLDLLDPGPAKYAVLGNWEYQAELDLGALRRVYEAHDCRLLVNESVIHRHGGAEVMITGVDDLAQGAPSLERALARVEPRDHHVVLAHCPAFRDQVVQWRRAVDERAAGGDRRFSPQYVLAGHTHGGQVAPFGIAPLRPWGSGRYLRGWYRDAQPELYVSQGLGTSGIPVRLGVPPEIASFEWLI